MALFDKNLFIKHRTYIFMSTKTKEKNMLL